MPRLSSLSWLLPACCLVLAADPALGLQCGAAPATSSRSTDVETGLALGAIKKLIGEVGLTFNVRRKQVDIYSAYPKADQLSLNQMFVYMLCTSLRDNKDLSESGKQADLERLRKEITAPAVQVEPVSLPRAASTVAPQASTPAATPAQASTAPDQSGTPKSKPTALPSDYREYHQRFLKQPPTVITSDNAWFVFAESPKSKEAGLQIYRAKVAKYPELEFFLFPPFQNGGTYGLAMGAWLSKAEAKQALQIAKQLGLAPTPYLWRCPTMGDQC